MVEDAEDSAIAVGWYKDCTELPKARPSYGKDPRHSRSVYPNLVGSAQDQNETMDSWTPPRPPKPPSVVSGSSARSYPKPPPFDPRLENPMWERDHRFDPGYDTRIPTGKNSEGKRQDFSDLEDFEYLNLK